MPLDITLYEFNSLNELEKIEALGEYGVILAHRLRKSSNICCTK